MPIIRRIWKECGGILLILIPIALYGGFCVIKDAWRDHEINKRWELFIRSNPNPTEDQLRYVIEHIPQKREEAARLLLHNHASFDNCELIISKFPELRVEATDSFLAYDLSIINFSSFMGRVPERAMQLWEAFLNTDSTSYCDILAIIEHAPPEVKELAWEEFIRRGPADSRLRLVINSWNAPREYKERAWNLLLSRNPPNKTLADIVDGESEYGKLAGREILRRNPDTNSYIRHVVRHAPELGEDAAALLLSKGPDSADLDAIINHVPKFRDSALVLSGRFAAELLKEMKDLAW
jgi:hypothetical protein